MNQQFLAVAFAVISLSSAQAATSPATSYSSWQRATAEPAQPLTREQVAQELARAREQGWQGYGTEETLDPQPKPTGVLSRDDVTAEYREWREAGALDEDSEAGPSLVTLNRRADLNNRQVERYARAIEAEQQRLARIEEQRRAAAAAAAAAAQAQAAAAAQQAGTAIPDSSATTAAPPSVTTSGETSSPLSSGTATAPMGPQPAPSDREMPPAAPSSDAAIDTTRPRSNGTAPMGPAAPDQAQPNPVR